MNLFSKKAEHRAIVSVLQGSHNVKAELMGKVHADHFGYRPMAVAWRAIESLVVKSSTDLPTMSTFLLEPGLEQETVDLLKSSDLSPLTKVDDAKRLIDILENYRVTRRFAKFSDESISMLEGESKMDIAQVMNDMENCLTDMRSTPDDEKMYHVGHGAENEDAIIEDLWSTEQTQLIPSCFSNFDKNAGGFGVNELFIPASHYKGGKSIITLNITTNMYMLNDVNVVYIPLEMSKNETMERLLSRISGVEHKKIRERSMSGPDRKAAREAWNGFKKHGKRSKCRFTVWPISHITVARLAMMLKPFEYNVVIIDYINLLDHPNAKGMADWQKLNDIAREVKLMSKDLNALVIAPTQMNEDGSLRYSRGLSEHANTVWTWTYKAEEQATNIITIDQPATRGYAPFKFRLKEDFSRMIVTDYLGSDDSISKPAGVKSMKGLRR